MKIVINYKPEKFWVSIIAEWQVADEFTRSTTGQRQYRYLWSDLEKKLRGMWQIALWLTDSINGEVMKNDILFMQKIAKERAAMCKAEEA